MGDARRRRCLLAHASARCSPLAATPGAGEAETRAVESAYFPWASGLNALLDSLVDLDEDPEDASHIRRYDSTEIAAERLATIAAGARSRVAALPDGSLHEAILAAMGALYLARARGLAPRPRADLRAPSSSASGRSPARRSPSTCCAAAAAAPRTVLAAARRSRARM